MAHPAPALGTLALLLAATVLAAGPVATAGDGVPAEGPEEGPALANSACSLGPGIHNLTHGVGVWGALPEVSGASCEFRFRPRADGDVIRFRVTGLVTGSDFDLYVRRAAVPTTNSYDCKSDLPGRSAEQCDLFNDGLDPQAFPWYVMVRRFSGNGPFFINATDEMLPELTSGVPAPGTVGTGQMVLWKLVVPHTAVSASFVLGGDPGAYACYQTAYVCSPASFTDADLYVRYQGLPTTAAFTCRSWNFGTLDGCVFSPLLASFTGSPFQFKTFPGPGKYVVGVRGFDGPADYVLEAVHR